jgi:hypothetical protein
MLSFIDLARVTAAMLSLSLIAACGGSASEPKQAHAADQVAGQPATPPPTAAGSSAGTTPTAMTAALTPTAATSASAGSAGSSTQSASVAGSAGAKTIAAAGAVSAGEGGLSGAAGAVGAAGATNTPTKTMIYWLDILGNTVWRANGDGSEATALVQNNNISAPDGIVVDLTGQHIYWTNMGSALGGGNLGTVQRAALDGSMVETLVPAGVGNTFKQMTMDRTHQKLYWCDREGAKVWRSDLDGKNHEVLASGHDFNQLVGIALDVARSQFYFTDRNAKKIMRAGFDMPAGQTEATRTDIEELFVFSGSSMPIDLDLDLDQRMIYWTDRGLGTVQRGKMDVPMGQNAMTRTDKETLITGVGEPIGISLDHDTGTLYFGNVAGQLEHANLDGSGLKMIGHSSSVTGVTVVHVPTP